MGAKNSNKDICIILDADLAVKASEIDKCINNAEVQLRFY